MDKPLVSILIPFKNVAPYLEECLGSIQQQTYLNYEVIAVNDHSNDDSLAIAQRYSAKDARFKIYCNEEKGIITALRKAYKHSKGTFITRMDSDDYMTEHKIETMVSALMNNGKGSLALGLVRYFSKTGVNDGYARYEKWLNKLTVKGHNFKEIYKECVIPSPCWMVYRSDFEICGAFKPNRYPEDYDLAFRFYEHGLSCIATNQVLHFWRDYTTRTSRTSEHYAQNYFIAIKLHYFLKLEYDTGKTLVVWGAGKKGKEVARSLIEKKIPFTWVCDNTKKIGKEIYGVKLLHYSQLEKISISQCIITVANEDEQYTIKTYLEELGTTSSVDYFFFC
ncbi:Glycosyltransferase involved in cell wall bisynthesis [Maribacter sedimenticola]|uniref:Glycosyltransferase involved in cell wall bisynthesis n=1 Tax=Maribacter sedimenticola TaxID=228956 RepID=A0ABY1SJK9_9FLAO|nr:glycosyltransferase family 2 protein [Maribacter sedimenticola]SNR65025.1 Glycosyltransferase involved in cell wall bisynthesis [Maribacter sedimenticola]